MDFHALDKHKAICSKEVKFWSVDDSYNSAVGTVRPLGFDRYEVKYVVKNATGFTEADIHSEFTRKKDRICVCSRSKQYFTDGSSIHITTYYGWENIRDNVVSVYIGNSAENYTKQVITTSTRMPVLCGDPCPKKGKSAPFHESSVVVNSE